MKVLPDLELLPKREDGTLSILLRNFLLLAVRSFLALSSQALVVVSLAMVVVSGESTALLLVVELARLSR